MNSKYTNFKFILFFFIFFFFSLTSNAYASNNDQLNVKIEENNEKITITETWNVVLKNGAFERELPISDKDINNISINTVFPKDELLDFKTEYNQRNNTTKVKTNVSVANGGACSLNVKYELTLDQRTLEKFKAALPNSLFANNSPNVENISLTLSGNENQNTATYNRTDLNSAENNKEFKQESSKSQTIEVVFLLIKIFVGVIFICIFCTVVYAAIMYFYYKNAKRFKSTKFKGSRRANKKRKKLKKQKRIVITKKF